jgi:hypothetical protein
MKIGTVALAVGVQGKDLVLLDQFTDDQEIAALEAAVERGALDPLTEVYRFRQTRAQEEEQFGNYVEELISKPGVRLEVQNHGLEWLKSKMKMEEFQQAEREASEVIARFAFDVFKETPERDDFVLAGPEAKVRIRVMSVQSQIMNLPDKRSA